jgi:23S rRNA (uracil1939-C5)-methyltransferase
MYFHDSYTFIVRNMNKNVKLDKEKEWPTAVVHALSHDGRGITTIDQKTTFVSGALPTETITYKLTQKRSTYNEAQVMAILEPSVERSTPPCQHFGLCGGCSLQHMSIEMQMQQKQQTLLDQLNHFGHVKPEQILTPLHAASVGYRRKARLGVKFVIKKNKLLVGFREKSSNYLAELTGCEVLHPAVGQRFDALSQLVASLSCYKEIPQIEVAIGDETVALVFRHLVPLTPNDSDKLAAFGKEHGIQVYLQPNSPLPVHKLWPHDNNERLTYTLPDEHLEFLFHPLDFTQINLDMNRLMVKQALSLLALEPHDKVLDLFCGIGNFTLPIARYAEHVTGIEAGTDMVTRANDNAKHNQLANVDFFAANLMQPPAQMPWMKVQYDKILLDPPRAGAKEILPYFTQFNAKKIVYVSCNPATLARDAGELVNEYGYRLKQAGIMNMFPHTSHIEAMALFEKI